MRFLLALSNKTPLSRDNFDLHLDRCRFRSVLAREAAFSVHWGSRMPQATERADKTIHQDRFLAVFVAYAHVGMAARAANVTRAQHYYWLEKDEGYARRFEEAKRKSARVFADEITRRGVHGVDKPVRYKGKVVGHLREYSDACLLAAAKAHIPEFRDRVEHTGPNGAQLVQERIREVILVALERYPEARQQVAQKLLELEASQETEAKP